MKFGVGVMLCSFGVFWSAEGAGVDWPGGDAILLVIAPLLLAASIVAVRSLRRAQTG
jgi:Ca2+/H+ antiporter, TMEM165/GDT1 family